MTVFPGGKSTRINSPRHLTLRHSRRLVTAYQREARRLAGVATLADEGDETDPLPPGEQKLNSYWAPGLEAGPKHNIHVAQSIDAHNGEEALQLEAARDFFVDAPQYSLPEGSVHSTYPPAGYSDDHRILPHVVLTDPHLPWERLGSPSAGTNKELRMKMKMLAAGKGGDPVRNRVPWLVILSFSQDELRLPPEDLDGPNSIFRNTSQGVVKPVKQSSTMTVNMSVDDLWKLTDGVKTPVTKDLGPDNMKDSRGDFVFVPPDLFKSFFSTFNTDGNRVTGSSPDTKQYQYLAHVRKINGSGMALAGVEDTAVFSIVVGTRSGPLDNVTPTTMCVHLVSIEGVEKMAWPTTNHRYVALCSLHSWNYTVLPPNSLNVPDAFEHLGRTLNVLRAPDEIIDPLRSSDDKVKQRLVRRLDDGYTLVKYRTQTGEPTVALYRGPLTPSYVPPLENLTTSSNSSVDLQILDKALGIMDVTYSVAWQVGRTIALGDEAFTAALVRLRNSIHSAAAAATKLQTLKEIDDTAFRTKADVLGDLDSLVKNLASIHLGPRHDLPELAGPVRQPMYAPGGAKRRWFRSHLGRAVNPSLSFASPLIRNKYPAAALKVARSLAGSTTGGVYNETNDPQSTDWMIVLSWLLDRMFLAGVPAHCLIGDPTYLGPESLRFFCIDSNWVDALIDGALSLGNHFGDDEDRVAIKKALNDYIGHTPEGQKHPVQIPSYGFYLRSDLVTMFPDLRVEVLPDDEAIRRVGQEPPSGAPLLRHEIVTDGVMMAFMDRVPGSAQFAKLVFTQPAHQQRFAVARGLDTAQVKVDIRRQYTVEQSIRERDKDRHLALSQIIYTPTGEKSSDNIFVWGSQPGKDLQDLRVLRLPRFADVQLKELQGNMPTYDDGGTKKPYFQDTASTSALFAMQLSDPIYNLVVDLKGHPPKPSIARLGRPGGEGSPDIRTLRLLGAARVKKLVASDSHGSSGGTLSSHKSDDDDSEQATFQRHKSYTPTMTALSCHLAPHVRTLTVDPREGLGSPAAVSSAAPGSGAADDSSRQLQGVSVGPAGSPKYEIRVGSNIIDKWDVITIKNNNLPQDLVFSVVLEQSKVSQYRLVELDIEFQLGPLTGTGADNHCLMKSYTGPGPRMLTNLRFNVVPALTDKHQRPWLRLRLIPRSAKGWCYATVIPELSFMLGLASINTPIRDRDEFVVQSRAHYCRNASLPLNDNNIFIINNPDTRIQVVNERNK